VIGPREPLLRVTLAAKEVRLPRAIRGDAGNLIDFGLIGNGICGVVLPGNDELTLSPRISPDATARGRCPITGSLIISTLGNLPPSRDLAVIFLLDDNRLLRKPATAPSSDDMPILITRPASAVEACDTVGAGAAPKPALTQRMAKIVRRWIVSSPARVSV
jgi:hypothetical protein